MYSNVTSFLTSKYSSISIDVPDITSKKFKGNIEFRNGDFCYPQRHLMFCFRIESLLCLFQALKLIKFLILTGKNSVD